MSNPEAYPQQSSDGHARQAQGQSRRRLLDGTIGALVMLGIVVLALLLLWLSMTRPVNNDDATPVASSAFPTAVPSTEATPPPDLAEDEVWLGDISLNASSVIAAGTPLLDVVGTGTDVTSGPDGLMADHVDLTATVPFDVVAAEIGPGATLSAADGGEVRVDTRVEAFGRSLPVGATGTVTVADGNLLMVPTAIDIGGSRFVTDLLGEGLQELVMIEHRIEGLPDGVVLRSVQVVDDGFRTNLTGDDIRLVE